MGKKPYGKRLLRLDKAQRADISGGGAAKQSDQAENVGKTSKGKGARKKQQQSMSVSSDAGPQMHAIRRITQTGMAGPRRTGPYTSRQRILLVGEGDFSFSLSLASSIGGSNLVCTSLDKASQLQVKYGSSVNATLSSLEGLGAEVHLQVDATSLQDYEFLRLANGGTRGFSRIIFNFPDVGHVEGEEWDAQENVAMITAFLASAAQVLQDDSSEIHVSLRFDQLEDLAIDSKAQELGLGCSIEDFVVQSFTGYRPQQTHPSAKGLPFACAKRYVFRRTAAPPSRGGSDAAAAPPNAPDDEAEDPKPAADPAAEAARREKARRKKRKQEMRQEDREWQELLFRKAAPPVPAAAKAKAKEPAAAAQERAAAQARAAAAFLMGRR